MTAVGTDVAHGMAAAMTVHVRPVIALTDDEFLSLCRLNENLRLERTARGDLVIMTPTGWETGRRNAAIVAQLAQWATRDGTGVATDASPGFRLANGAVRAPDAAWVAKTHLVELTADQRRRFLPLSPDFVIELRSPTDQLSDLQAKMAEYVDNGTRLGWLIDPEEERVYTYQPGRTVECLERPAEVSGDPVLPGFVLDLREIWEPPLPG